MNMSNGSLCNIKWWLSDEIFIPVRFGIALPFAHKLESLQGWGAPFGHKRTGGLWSENEKEYHINWLELKASFLALQSLGRKNSHIY